MFRSGWLFLALACAAGAALGAVPRPPADAVVRGALDAVPIDDPFPIRRVRVPAAKLPDLLKELDPGPVVRLPRAEFEARVRAAGFAAAQAKHGPRIVEANYTAELDGSDLTGTANLAVLNASGAPSFLSLDPLRLAVRGAKWGTGEDAVLAAPPGAAAPAVWVAGDGRKALQFRWSLAGTVQPGERRFELKVPVCAAAALELDLPADRVPTALTDALLTGPFDVAGGDPGRKRWRFRFGGRPRLEFAVRATGAPSAGATAALVAKYELSPNQLAAAFEYELRPARGSVGEWSFLADPGLRVTDVIANNRAGWAVEPPAAPNGPARVKVTLRQPGAGGKVLITAVAPLPDPARHPDAPLPAVRPLGAVAESESVEVRVAPGLKVESWAPGDYHLADATTATDLTRVLSLSGALLPPGSEEPFRRMPSVRVTSPESEFNTFERLEWSPGPGASRLIARVSVRATRGPLFQLVVRPPAGFVLDRGAAATDERIAHIDPPVGGGQTIELARPLLTGQQADLRFEFRGPGARAGTPVPFPVFAVAGATERDGWLSVAAASGYALKLQPGAGAVSAGLWGWLVTDAPAGATVYLYHAQTPDGTLTLAPPVPVLKADVVVSVGERGGLWLATARLALASTGGPADVVAFVPGTPDGARTWTLTDSKNAVVGTVPVPAQLAAALSVGPCDLGAGLVGAAVRTGAGNGTFWFVRFAGPLSDRAVLETAAPGPPLQAPEFVLGVPRLCGAEQVTRAELAPALRSRASVELKGAEVRARATGAPAGARVTDAYLLTAVRDPREVVAAFGATVRGSTGAPLAVGLPPGAEVRGVCVGGHWLGPSACAARDGGALRVPLPAGAAVRFEVRYRLPTEPGWPTRGVVSPVPTLADAPPVSRWWSFADGVLPGWPVGPWGAAADDPPLLGGPLMSGPPALVSRSAAERVQVGAVRTTDAITAALVAVVVAGGIVARRARAAVTLGAVAVAALAVAEFGPPWWARGAWPVLGAAAVALARALWGGAMRPRAAVVAGALTAGLLFDPFGLVAQPPAPATVFISVVDGSEEVTAPVGLLERLDALVRPPLPGPLVTAAAYDVRADDTGARVTARFVAHALRSSDNVLALPLGDARLEGVTVNGRPALPTALRPDTYAVPLGGAGRYEVEARFAAGVTVTGAERDLKFGTPEVPDAKLTAVLPAAARQPQAAGRLGRQAVTAGERVTVEADVGAAKQVHLRWSEGGSGAAAVKVREACVWDVTDGGAELTAAYLVRVEQGAVAGLRVDVPAELEVLRVAVRAPDALGTAPALQDWQLGAEKGGFRALRIDFQGPSAGRFLVVLECGPRKPLTRQPVLRFPRLVFGSTKGETDPVYALRATRVTVDEVGRAGVIDFSADALRDFVPVSDLKLDPAHLPRAFRPAPGASAELRPVLRAGDGPGVASSTAWAVGPTRADAAGTLSWAGDAPVALLEFSVPGARVLEVRGPDVVGWGSAAGRVQVWLRAGTREGAIEWVGTLDRGGPPGAETPFEPAAPVVVGGKHTSAEVRVRPAPGWAVRLDRARGWQAAPAPAGELRFRAAGPPAQNLRVLLTPLSALR